MFLDNTFEESLAFILLKDMLLVAVGFDKSDSDFMGTWRPCNRHKGNSAIFVQIFASLEGPVCECYENEEITIGNAEYLIQDTIQKLVDDWLYCMVFQVLQRGNVVKCECYVFSPLPLLHAGAHRPLHVINQAATITKDMAFGNKDGVDTAYADGVEGSPDELNDGETGFSPELCIPITVDHLSIQLLCSNNNVRDTQAWHFRSW